jgi:hypothetical protein
MYIYLTYINIHTTYSHYHKKKDFSNSPLTMIFIKKKLLIDNEIFVIPMNTLATVYDISR